MSAVVDGSGRLVTSGGQTCLTSGFTPDAGYSYSGSIGFDVSGFTIIKAGGGFGPIGPILALFDDLRGGVDGTLITARTPFMGSTPAYYNGSGPPGGSKIILRRTNRAGTGVAASILDNERAGGTVFGRGATIDLGVGNQQVVVFYAETSRGTWDWMNDEGGGGGYFKQNWILNTDGQYSDPYFDCVLPDFVESCSTATLNALSWSAGVATATVTAGIPGLGATPGYQWTVSIAGVTPSGWNVSSVLATSTGPNSFTFSLATNPGATTSMSGANYVVPGGSQAGNVNPSGVPCTTSISYWVAGNNSVVPVTPAGNHSPSLILGGNGTRFYDQTNWNSHVMGYLADPVNPTTATGIIYDGVWNPANGQAVNYLDTSRRLLDPTTNYTSFRWLQFVGLMQQIGTHTVDRCDFYVACGPNAAKMFFISDQSTLAASTSIMPFTIDQGSAPVGQPAAGWTDTAVSMTPRRGEAPAILAGRGWHLWYSDQAFNISHVGVFI